MGAYASATDIQGEFKSLVFSASTTPTLTQVTAFIAEEEAVAEAKVGKKYTVPVTGTKALLVMRNIVIKLVAGRVKNILPTRVGASQANQSKESDGDSMIKAGRDMLDLIVSGELLLADASLASTNDGVRSFNVDNQASDTDDSIDEDSDAVTGSGNPTIGDPANSTPAFQRGRRMW